MSSQTKEIAFESHVEETLLTLGWKQGTNAEWDKANALFPAQVISFLQMTQAKQWAEMENAHGAGLESLLIKSLIKELDGKGTLHVLRHGFKFYGKILTLAYFRAAHWLNYELDDLFEKNQLTLTRQVACHPSSNATVDILLAINGLPVATIELKRVSFWTC